MAVRISLNILLGSLTILQTLSNVLLILITFKNMCLSVLTAEIIFYYAITIKYKAIVSY